MTGSKEQFMEERQEQPQYVALFNESVALTPTKENIENSANNLVTKIKDGEINPFELFARMEALKAFYEQVRGGAMEVVLDELDKYGKEALTVLGAKFERMEGGIKYDYSLDPVWAEIKAQEDEVIAKRKEVEQFLKPLKLPLQQVDKQTGEIIIRYAPGRTSASTFKITLQKK